MRSKVASLLKGISLGQYQTTLYNKQGSAFQSSVQGGLVTLVLMIGIFTFATSLLVDNFRKVRFNLDITAEPINAYNVTEDDSIYANRTLCTEGCRNIQVRDFPTTLGTFFSISLFNATNCSDFRATLYIQKFGDNSCTQFMTLNFTQLYAPGFCGV